MGQAAVTIRMDADIKRQFDALCQDFPLKIARPPTVFVRALGESPALGHAARTAVFERRVRQIL